MDKDSKKEKRESEMEIAHKRQQFQMHQKGYSDIVTAISNIKMPEIEMPEMDMSETNKILSELVAKMNEPICLTLKLK